jgi:hypothetical protein
VDGEGFTELRAKKAHTGPKFKEPMDHMGGIGQMMASVILVVPEGSHHPKEMRGPPYTTEDLPTLMEIVGSDELWPVWAVG